MGRLGGGRVDGAENQKVYGFQTTVNHQSISLLSPAYSSSAPPINIVSTAVSVCVTFSSSLAPLPAVLIFIR